MNVGAFGWTPPTTALTNAWLRAVWRVQHDRNQQPTVGQAKRSMTDVIERAPRGGGLDPKEPQWVDPFSVPETWSMG